MAPVLSLRPQARAEVAEAYDWYELRRSGLGERFLSVLGETLNAIEQAPRRYPRIRGEVRRACLKRFPYCVLYLAEPAEVVVIAVFHSARDPRRWQSQV